jgi:hypothetical protein
MGEILFLPNDVGEVARRAEVVVSFLCGIQL